MKNQLVVGIASLLLFSLVGILGFKMFQIKAIESPVQPTSQSTNDKQFQPLITAIQTQMKAQQVPGVAVAIVQDGKIIFQQGFGVRNAETKDPVTPNTLFRIGSTTKPLTVIGLMQLVEAGKIKLDAPVVTYLPTFRVNPKITVRQLISHTAGLADLAEPYGRTDAAALKDAVTSLTPQSSFAPPGKVLSYSNPGFSVAGALLEAVSGSSYTRYMDEQVFPKLGMTQTTFNPGVALTYPLAVGYQPSPKGLEIVRPTPDNAAQYPAGFAFSSVQDLSQLMLLLLQNGNLKGKSVLSGASMQAMKTPVLRNAPLNVGYGLGLFIAQEDGVTTIGHGGAINGYTTVLETFPEQKLGIVILANKSGFDPTPVLDTLRQSLLKLPKPNPKPPLKLDKAALMAYTGNYRLTNATGQSVGTLAIAPGQGNLKGKIAGQPDVELRPISLDLFEIRVGGQTVGNVAFLRDETGKVAFFSQGLRAYSRSTP